MPLTPELLERIAPEPEEPDDEFCEHGIEFRECVECEIMRLGL